MNMAPMKSPTKTMKTATVLAVAMTAALAAGTQAQQIRDSGSAAAPPRMGTAVLSGMVVTDEQTPQPVRRATVSAVNTDGSVSVFYGRLGPVGTWTATSV